MKRILVDLSSVADLLYQLALLHLGYKLDNLHGLGKVLIGFNGLQTNSMGEIVLPVSIGQVTSLVPFTVIDESSSFNAILGRIWIHTKKALPSSYHQKLGFLTPQGQIGVRGDKKVARTCYKVHHPNNESPTK